MIVQSNIMGFLLKSPGLPRKDKPALGDYTSESCSIIILKVLVHRKKITRPFEAKHAKLRYYKVPV